MIFSTTNSDEVINNLITMIKSFDFLLMIRITAYIVIGVLITLYMCRLIGKMSAKHLSAHHSQLLRRITFYIGLGLSIVFPLKLSGIDITGLLGAAGIAAGIVTAAVAFASQTSISNFLSGMFLIAEKPFEVGDFVHVNDTIGEILSIDLLSVKIRTKDNIFVRIPNESLLKSQFENLTRFPIRRYKVMLQVHFHEDLERLKKILFDVAKQNSLCLVSPPPEFLVMEFGDNGLILQFSVWGKQSSFTQLQSSIQTDIQVAFKQYDIQLPTNSAMYLAPTPTTK